MNFFQNHADCNITKWIIEMEGKNSHMAIDQNRFKKIDEECNIKNCCHKMFRVDNELKDFNVSDLRLDYTKKIVSKLKNSSAFLRESRKHMKECHGEKFDGHKFKHTLIGSVFKKTKQSK